jgi:hypothetical protein
MDRPSDKISGPASATTHGAGPIHEGSLVVPKLSDARNADLNGDRQARGPSGQAKHRASRRDVLNRGASLQTAEQKGLKTTALGPLPEGPA